MSLLILEEDLRVVALNGTAEMLFGSGEAEILGQKTGEALFCLNALSSPRGCGGTPRCSQCVLRRPIREAIEGAHTCQREVKVSVRNGEQERERILLLSAAPCTFEGRVRATAVLQDVTVLHRLRGLIPICASCNKIRKNDRAWVAREQFIEGQAHVEFTHGLCPRLPGGSGSPDEGGR